MLEFAGSRELFGHAERARQRRKEYEQPGAFKGWKGTDELPMRGKKHGSKKLKEIKLSTTTAAQLRKEVRNEKTWPMTRLKKPRMVLIKFLGNKMEVLVVGINIGQKKIFIDTKKVDNKKPLPAPSWMLQKNGEWKDLKRIVT